ncbi:MAG: hypothetical protein RIR70_515 [Pseudomonadota bacterium]
MPTYLTSLTLIAAGLVAAGAVCAQGNQYEAGSQSVVVGGQAGYITVEESVGSAPSLRQTHRLGGVRYAATPSVAIMSSSEREGLIGEPVLMTEPVAVVTFEANSSVAAVAKSPMVDTVLGDSARDSSVILAAASDRESSGAARIVEWVRDGVLKPEVGAELLIKQEAQQAIPTVKPGTSKVAYTPGGAVTGVVTDAPVRAIPVAAQPVAEPLVVASAVVTPPIVLAAAAAASSVQEAPPQAWTLAREDRTVRTALERWARQMEWNVSWEFPTDFQIEFNADFDGDFIDAVAKVVEGLSVPERPVRAEFYKGNRVLRILSGRQ